MRARKVLPTNTRFTCAEYRAPLPRDYKLPRGTLALLALAVFLFTIADVLAKVLA